jgi:hypothetical protein
LFGKLFVQFLSVVYLTFVGEWIERNFAWYDRFEQLFTRIDSLITFQAKHRNALDLSFNKLTGVLDGKSMYNYSESPCDDTDARPSSIALFINLLSGQVPKVLHGACSVDILLIGNMFTCNAFDKQQSLPTHDQHRRSYECGSNSVNTAIYTLLVWLVCIAMFALAYHFREYWLPIITTKSEPLAKQEAQEDSRTKPHSSDVSDNVQSMQSAILSRWQEYWYFLYQFKRESDSVESNLSSLAFTFKLLRRWISIITFALVLFATPIYSSLSVFYSTYIHSCAWIFSLPYKAGVAPVVIATLTLLSITYLAFIACFPWISKKLEGDVTNGDILKRCKRLQKLNQEKSIGRLSCSSYATLLLYWLST